MLNETRVNLLHLLEDIRDSYAVAMEEVIVTELIANALDSGASKIEFTADPEQGFIRASDNGCGMKREELKAYHNIATTAKIRGRGIGFAGIGAKLSLLAADKVITETKGPRGTRSATEWHLTNPFRAPWKFVPFSGSVTSPRGTAITIFLRGQASPLFEHAFITRVIQKHFHSFFHPHLIGALQRFIYRKAIEFWVNGQKLEILGIPYPADTRAIKIYLGRRNRQAVGFGYISKENPATETRPPEGLKGIAISTYGKIIKCGWEWTGIIPRSYEKLFGVIEIPGLAEILTTNKADFLNDAASLKKYYRFRKAVQEAIHPVLQQWGEERTQDEITVKRARPLEREIEDALGVLLLDFPELTPLVRLRYRSGTGTKDERETSERNEYLTGVKEKGEETVSDIAESVEQEATGSNEHNSGSSGEGPELVKRRGPGIKIGFEEAAPEGALARLAEDTVFINTSHSAWKKASRDGAEDYHIIAATAWGLSSFLEEGRSPQEFVAKFLAAWGKSDFPPGKPKLSSGDEEKATPRLI